jgi:thiol-disulfide isomerase/thioredoxin
MSPDLTPAAAPPSPPAGVPARRRRLPWPMLVGIAAGCGLAFLVVMLLSGPTPVAGDDKKAAEKKDDAPARAEERPKVAAPPLDGGVAWLNTGGPLTLKDLKGKVVLLDFWTLCCINCIHILPDLAKLEKKYANELVVIGVHSPKFDNEKDTRSIRKAILRYEIAHPVVNDADRKIWDRYEVDAWPTFVLIDPEGNLVGFTSGEGNYEILDVVIGKLVAEHKKKKTLDEKPVRFDLARYREKGDTPLFFPGKVLADPDGKRLFIADSTHHRVVVTDLDGNKLAVAGTGTPGKEDGPFDKAQFDDPQGMAVKGDTLYVADRKNHTIRELDLKAGAVKTIAGNGQQEMEPAARRLPRPVPARSIGLNSPWDLLLIGNSLYVAMAGHHQIWVMDLANKDIGPYAGNGRENIGDGPAEVAMFAQPSGLATDGQHLYVADSEISALRQVRLGGGKDVATLVGRGLFVFGDRDGPGRVADAVDREKTEARLQHALGVAHADGKLYVADTYNSKIKVFDLGKKALSTFLGGDEPDGWLFGPLFSEPAGISYAAGKLYVADTNAHRIRVVDLATKKVETLRLKGVEPPPLPKEPEKK